MGSAFGEMMSRNRFTQIKKFLRFNDGSGPRNDDQLDNIQGTCLTNASGVSRLNILHTETLMAVHFRVAMQLDPSHVTNVFTAERCFGTPFCSNDLQLLDAVTLPE